MTSLALDTEKALSAREEEAVRLLDADGWTHDELALCFQVGTATVQRALNGGGG
jgi:predicted DNA-binding protein (UPF0251 family)